MFSNPLTDNLCSKCYKEKQKQKQQQQQQQQTKSDNKSTTTSIPKSAAVTFAEGSTLFRSCAIHYCSPFLFLFSCLFFFSASTKSRGNSRRKKRYPYY
jgi:hypothetical protein